MQRTEHALAFLWDHGFLLKVRVGGGGNSHDCLKIPNDTSQCTQGKIVSSGGNEGRSSAAVDNPVGVGATSNQNLKSFRSSPNTVSHTHDQSMKLVQSMQCMRPVESGTARAAEETPVEQFVPSPLGKATVLSGIPPRDAVENLGYLQVRAIYTYVRAV